MIDNKLFNTDKDYKQSSVLLGEKPGIFDTVNNTHTDIWDLYKAMKALDWDANEFNYTSCIKDFKTCDESVYNKMIKTLAFQWEADTLATRTSPISGIFLTSDQAWACDQRISDNEVVHAETYSEIVRNSFQDPSEVLNEVLKIDESLDRLDTVSSIMGKAYDTAHKYALGLVENNQETYNDAFMYYVALLVLERVQFMSSFAVTFTICDTGLFQPIGKAVQKIAKDELEVHVKYRKAVIRNELKTERGKIAMSTCKPVIEKLIDDVSKGEDDFLDYLFSDGSELVGSSKALLRNWKDWCLVDVYSFLGIEPKRELPTKNPLPFLENRWLNTNKVQISPQSEIGAYPVNVTARDDDETTFDIDF